MEPKLYYEGVLKQKMTSSLQDNILREAVINLGPEGWEKIASKVSQQTKGDRSSSECQSRWAKIIRPEGMHQGAWTIEEDGVIRDMVQVHGTKHWAQIAKVLLCRSGKQCRERWFNVLDPDIKRDPFSAEEDELILKEKFKEGSKWASIANKLEGRTDNAIKNRYNSTLRRVMTHARQKLLENGEIKPSQTDSECCWQLLEELKRQELLGDGTKKLTSRPGNAGGTSSGRPKNNTRNRGGLKVNYMDQEALIKLSNKSPSGNTPSSRSKTGKNTDRKKKATSQQQRKSKRKRNPSAKLRKAEQDESESDEEVEYATTDDEVEEEEGKPSRRSTTRRKSPRKTKKTKKPSISTEKGKEDFGEDFPSAHASVDYGYVKNFSEVRGKPYQQSPGSRSTNSHEWDDEDRRSAFPKGGVATLAAVAGIMSHADASSEQVTRLGESITSPLIRFETGSPNLGLSSRASQRRDTFSSLDADEGELPVTTLNSKGFTPSGERDDKVELSTGGSQQYGRMSSFPSAGTPGYSGQVRSPSSMMSPGTGTGFGVGTSATSAENPKSGSTATDQSTTHASSASSFAPQSKGIAYPQAKRARKNAKKNKSDSHANGELPPKPPVTRRDTRTARGSSSASYADTLLQGNPNFMSPAEAYFRQSANDFAVAPQHREWSRTTPPVHSIQNVGETPNIDNSSTGNASPSERASVDIPSGYRYDANNAPPTDDESERGDSTMSVSPFSPRKRYGGPERSAGPGLHSASPNSRSSALSRAGASRSDIEQFSPSRRSPGRPKYVNNNTGNAPRRRLYDNHTSPVEDVASAISASLAEES